MAQVLPPNTGETWAIVSRKGGPGKSTAVHGIATGMSLRGYKTLVCEVEDNMRLWHLLTGRSHRDGQLPPDDSQTVYGLFTHPERGLGRAAYQIDVGSQFARCPGLTPPEVAHLTQTRGWTRAQPMDFLPGSQRLRQVEHEFAAAAHDFRAGGAAFSPFVRLSRAMETIQPQYDLVILDTPPTLNIIQHNAVLAAHRLIIVVDFDVDSIEDYERTCEFVEQVQASARGLRLREPEILGVVYNKYDASFEDNDARLLTAYTTTTVDERGRGVPPLVRHESLGVLPFDRHALVGAANKRVSIHTWAPTKSKLGPAMYNLCTALEERTGLYRYNPLPNLASAR
jgi:cellulose biosynthesis protein BcsQ